MPPKAQGKLVISTAWLQDFSGPSALPAATIGSIVANALNDIAEGLAEHFHFVVGPEENRGGLQFYLMACDGGWELNADEVGGFA